MIYQVFKLQKPSELFIQETDFGKANPVIEEFRLSL